MTVRKAIMPLVGLGTYFIIISRALLYTVDLPKTLTRKNRIMKTNKKIEIIKDVIIQRFDEIQSLMQKRPILGSEKWFLTDIRMIDDFNYELKIEDGHIEGIVIVKYIFETEKFEIIKEKVDS